MPVFLIGLTVAILFLAEILPKTIGANYWRTLWPAIVWPVTGIKLALNPIVKLTQVFVHLFTKAPKAAVVTEDEILALIQIGAKEGEISREESRMVQNIIDLEEKNVKEIMSSRTVVVSIDGNLTVDEAIQYVHEKGFSRFPVFEKDRENIIGYITKYDLHKAKNWEEGQKMVKEIVRAISAFSEDVNCLILLKDYLKHRKHISIVSDKYGGISGLVTLEDLLETILGAEIVDETDQAVDLQKTAKKWKENIKES